MTDEQINQRIAEVCGWKWERLWTGELHGKPIGEQGPFRELPDYLNDLNAMHEAENQMELADLKSYCEMLCNWIGADWGRAPAYARAEAFLQTIGKWEGEA